MLNLKQMVRKYLNKTIFMVTIGLLLMATCIALLWQQQQAKDSAKDVFNRLEQVLNDNKQDLETVQEEYRSRCLSSAEAIAYIVQNNQEVLDDTEELRKLAKLIGVDEIHVFNKSGVIYAGTHPEYYGYSFDSGEQMNFFKPMLEDKTLRLCQDIEPNTADGKLMQYSALWSEDEKFIIQVGMQPVKVMQATEKNELSYIFSMFKLDTAAHLYAIDVETGTVVGSCVATDVGKNLTELGFSWNRILEKEDGFHAKINGVNSYCVFTKIDDKYIGRIVPNDLLYAKIPVNILVLALCLLIIGVIQVNMVAKYINKYVIHELHVTNDMLREIGKGNLEKRVDIQTSVEFSEFSAHINDMIKSLLANINKMSLVLNKTDLIVGVYEYNENMMDAQFTDHIPVLLAFDEDMTKKQSIDSGTLKSCIDNIRKNPIPNENDIYCVNAELGKYVRIEEVKQDDSTLGIVVDVSEEMVKRKKLEEERDLDILTGLYNRRGLENRLANLFAKPDKLKYGAIIMIDADGLKHINDTYGHEKGDVYLKKIAGILKNFGLRNSVAARFGGDEYVLFIYDYDDEDEVLNTIRTLQYIQNNSTASLGENISVPLKFSVGYSMIKGKSDYNSMIKEADENMYIDKQQRKQKN